MKIECFSKVNYIYINKVEWFETLVGKSFHYSASQLYYQQKGKMKLIIIF